MNNLKYRLYWYIFRDQAAAYTFIPVVSVLGMVVATIWLWLTR